MIGKMTYDKTWVVSSIKKLDECLEKLKSASDLGKISGAANLDQGIQEGLSYLLSLVPEFLDSN